ncbi:hypothetical protein HGA64_00640 [Candidatus Falkowbacteria bacterium]|nr:hypothetical protein [Candidatus Falkowbacteria bacterium]
MENFEKLNLGGIPEKFMKEGVYAHYKELVKVGDIVEAIRDVNDGEIPRGTKVRITEIIVDPKENLRGFEKRIRVEGYEGDYNPKRFKKADAA